jgi:hypothetical protein
MKNKNKSRYVNRRHSKPHVRVRPLPKYMHRTFQEFVAELRNHAASHYGTWRYAAARNPETSVQMNAIYWRSVLKYLNTLEYLGTHNEHTDGIP